MAGQMASLRDKTVLITGATRGIGEVAAVELARKGAHVVVVGRDAARLEETARRVAEASGRRPGTLLADLSVQSEVRRVASEFRAAYSRLDVLINNAGAFYAERRVTRDGIEMTWALNHLSGFLLTSLLLDMLRASAPARIINVSSEAHRMGRMDFADVERRRGYSAWGAYGQSKLANILFTTELTRRLAGTGVTANALHPGFVATGFGKNNSGLWGWLLGLAQVMAISPEEGAKTTIYLASSPEVEGVSGKYFDKCRAVEPAAAAKDVAAAARLWELSERMVDLASPAPAPRAAAG
ncbi:MAG: hypothetical protein RLZZ387_1307 [Chloroflexota bacterium]